MEQCGPEQVIGEQRSTPPFSGLQEYGVLLEPNAAYHPCPYPDSLALHAGQFEPGIVEYCQPPQEFMPPVLFTSLAPYAPPYMYQPMAAQLATHATQTTFYTYPPAVVLGPTLVTTPFWEHCHYGQPHSWAPVFTSTPVSHLPQKNPETLHQELGPRQQSQYESQKLMLTGAHSPPLTGTTPMPRKQILQSKRQYRPRKSKRTEYVMWVGNIDPTVTLDELYLFFRQVDRERLPPSESAVVSIHMIQKSHCALVNYKTELALLNSVQMFHGMRLRNYPQAPRLACRRKEQGLTVLLSSVGGTNDTSTINTSGEPQTRYFVMKSLTTKALLESVETGTWRTQVQNEFVLDCAYHEPSVVYLIFGANKSGEFFGYAKMAGPIHDIDNELHDANDAELSAPENADGVVSVPSNPGPWGKSFPIEWIMATPLPFRLVRHLRNPWNGNGEIKLSNDGCELETRVGESLLSLWTTRDANDD